jgi:hypothetical protein
MPYFEVTYEDVGFTADDIHGCQLDEHFLAEYSEAKVREDGFPSNVRAISEAYVTEDDAQTGEKSKSVVITVTLVLEAESESAIHDLATPEGILSEVSSQTINAGGADILMGLQQSWAISNISEATDFSVGFEPDNVSDD